MNALISKLSLHLFWDVPRGELDSEIDKAFIIKRVLEYGLWNDWLLIERKYGVQTISTESQHFRELDPKALAFISVLSEIPKEKFRCYTTRQLTELHWNF